MLDFALPLLIVVCLPVFLLHRRLQALSSERARFTRTAAGLLLLSLLCFALARITGSSSPAAWPAQAWDDEKTERAMVVRHLAHPVLRNQLGFLQYGTRIRSVMGKDFTSPKELNEALSRLKEDDVVTAEVWSPYLSRTIALPVGMLRKGSQTKDEALERSLGLSIRGTTIWNFASPLSFLPLGFVLIKNDLILTIHGMDAAYPETWRRGFETLKDEGSVEFEVLEHGKGSTYKVTVTLNNYAEGDSWEVILPPRLAIPTSYGFAPLSVLISPFAAWARFFGFGSTRWIDLFTSLGDIPLDGYRVASLAWKKPSFWFHHHGSALAVAAGLSLLAAAVSPRTKWSRHYSLIIHSLMIIGAGLFLLKNLFEVHFV